jgi:hypothetical protein
VTSKKKGFAPLPQLDQLIIVGILVKMLDIFSIEVDVIIENENPSFQDEIRNIQGITKQVACQITKGVAFQRTNPSESTITKTIIPNSFNGGKSEECF